MKLLLVFSRSGMVKIIKKRDFMKIIDGDKVLHLVLNTQGKQLFASGKIKF